MYPLLSILDIPFSKLVSWINLYEDAGSISTSVSLRCGMCIFRLTTHVCICFQLVTYIPSNYTLDYDDHFDVMLKNLLYSLSDPPDPDFSDTPINITVPADSTTFELPPYFTINDDNIDENEQSFAIVAEIGRDVPENISCFQTAVGETDCFGRRGATEKKITDNDRKLSNQMCTCTVV